MAEEMQSIAPGMIRGDSEYNVRTLVLKQVDRLSYLMSMDLSHTVGLSAVFRARAFGSKAGLLSLQALISPFIDKDSAYMDKSRKIQKILRLLERQGRINSEEFVYWDWLCEWYSLLIQELSRLGYFPNSMEEIDLD